jgi:hypothetical protein
VFHSVAGFFEVVGIFGQGHFFWNPKEATCLLFELDKFVVLDFFKALDSNRPCWVKKHLAMQIVCFGGEIVLFF